MIEVALQEYPDRETMVWGLAELVGDQLRAAHASHGRATLSVPGGSTPGPFLEALSEADLDCPEIDVLLTDERMVGEHSTRSNTRLVRETLLQGPARNADLIHYHAAGTRIELVLDTIRERVDRVLPLDVAVLGMGTDLHTASLFPGAPELADALKDDAPSLMIVRPPGQPEGRVTLSARVLRDARTIHVLIMGREKRVALDQALQDGPVEEAPIRAALTAPCPVTVHYAD